MIETLTPREREVYELTRAGLSAREIAARLGLARTNTVHVYRCRIADKLGVPIADRLAGRRSVLSRELVDDQPQT